MSYPLQHFDHDTTRAWATEQFVALGVSSGPAYGTRYWLDLDEHDPRRAAAIIEAAELWRRHCSMASARRLIQAETEGLRRT